MIIRPRLSDYYNIPLLQAEVDFAIPFMDEDIPLYVDSFLLWKSPSQMDNMQHIGILNSFNSLGQMYIDGKCEDAITNLVFLSECDEVGLGLSKTRKGRPISKELAQEILELFKQIPQVGRYGIKHLEQIQLLIDQISKDRISDIACSLLKSFLIDYTYQECLRYSIPTHDIEVYRYDYKHFMVIKECVSLPMNEESKQPIIFVPKRWLRFTPWLNYDDYFNNYLIKNIEEEYDRIKNRIHQCLLKYVNLICMYFIHKYLSGKHPVRDLKFAS